MQHTASIQAYHDELMQRGDWPAGFSGRWTTLTFVPSERPGLEPYRMNLAAILPDQPVTAFAGVFTRNRFPGAPVISGRQILQHAAASGILVNNRIANVCSPSGLQDITALQQELGRLSGASPEGLFCVSTGIIGWSLPLQEITAAMPQLLQTSAQPIDVARAIMTTDSFPKLRAARCAVGSVLGIAKGAGMIEPNMATMLVFLVTDLEVSREDCQRALSAAVETSFNRISVDSDQSTSDMALLLSSGKGGTVAYEQFSSMVAEVCQGLAQDIVRNGEGVAHVIEVTVSGARSSAEARDCGKAIVNSPLVKTAIYGNDPNVGRIVAALGDHCGNSGIPIVPEAVRILVEDVPVFQEGAFRLSSAVEQQLSERLTAASMNPRITGYPQNDDCVRIHIDLGMGDVQESVLGTDLSHEYVTENADYRT
ncbi:bifunctional glutamate N-acetyltransferase/amino-acid acetyltransferase ArgJ [Spirochaeta africana]|uniref:Arginine biosynthesis bifunctional protein ArgJ n=1 Tax=Spirochaeta africana (strain ATCC 700263 / DSM 8902 / Z-7692) TaxID=889378 RepID=H9UM25_SPIAZ|nr:bifunctional glutamate N-acetyltransferase/amino-acid acetyltransferase ArgJ [Spirochaeta africana]AFG38568.1 glutamate N-acetyltransferase/amino-acid acetyltransferase [Spirochaeta africana DSM 8902]